MAAHRHGGDLPQMRDKPTVFAVSRRTDVKFPFSTNTETTATLSD
jgi:hypothetical protein